MTAAISRIEGYRERRAELAEYGLTKSDLIELALHITTHMPVVTIDEFEAAMTAYEKGELK